MPNPTFNTITQSTQAGTQFDGAAPSTGAKIEPVSRGRKVHDPIGPGGHAGLFQFEVADLRLDVASQRLPRDPVPSVARPVAWELGADFGDAATVTISIVDEAGNLVHLVYKSTAWPTDSPDGTLTLVESEVPKLRPGHDVKVVTTGGTEAQTCTVGREVVTQ